MRKREREKRERETKYVSAQTARSARMTHNIFPLLTLYTVALLSLHTPHLWLHLLPPSFLDRWREKGENFSYQRPASSRYSRKSFLEGLQKTSLSAILKNGSVLNRLLSPLFMFCMEKKKKKNCVREIHTDSNLTFIGTLSSSTLFPPFLFG